MEQIDTLMAILSDVGSLLVQNNQRPLVRVLQNNK